MRIGDLVTHEGRLCYVRGFDPMSVPERRVYLEDAATGDRFRVALDRELDLVETLLGRLETQPAE